jgi:NADPH:quinone reductase-like Zn-dependent oxidoreductase
MKAVSFYKSLPIEDPQSLADVSVEAAKPSLRDLLVEVRAISVNPVDTKIRAGGDPGKHPLKIGSFATFTQMNDTKTLSLIFHIGQKELYVIRHFS